MFYYIINVLLLYYGDLWSVIFDGNSVIVLEYHNLHPFKTENLIDKYCVHSDCSIN